MLKNFDYGKEYNEFWNKDERWGTNSFEDITKIINEIVKTCGEGSVLDVGCGMGNVVKEFCKKGIEAYGVDVASIPIEYNNKEIPGHFFTASILNLPFNDNNFDTVITTDCLEHIRTEDIEIALRELFRVTKKNLYVRLSMREDYDSRWHLTIKDKTWWENMFLKSGFKKHPLYAAVSGYGDTNYTESQLVALYIKDENKKLDEEYAKIEKLDVFFAKCMTISEYIQNGDNVVILTNNNYAFKYIIENINKVGSIKCINSLSQLKTNVDFFIVDADKIDDTSYLEKLNPGCRIIFIFKHDTSIENIATLTQNLFVERTWKISIPNSNYWKAIDEYLVVNNFNKSVKVNMLLAMKDPLSKNFIDYKEMAWGEYGEKHNFVDFKNNYINPYIWKIVLSSPHRDVKTNIKFCQRIINEYPNNSADYGGALCYLSYRLLESTKNWNELNVNKYINLIKEYLDIKSNNTHVYRWQISLTYVMAQLYLKIGKLDEAKNSLLMCIKFNPKIFSPTIATKIMLSYEQLCVIDKDNSIKYWKEAILLLEKLFDDINWTDIYGDKNIPVAFGFNEMGEIFNIIAKIAWRIYYDGKPYPFFLKTHKKITMGENISIRNRCIFLEKSLLEKEEARKKLEKMLEEAVQEKERQINEYEKSFSWRITSPFRKIRYLFK